MLVRFLLLLTLLALVGKAFFLVRPRPSRKHPSPASLVQDPICGLYLEPQNAEEFMELDGTRIYFCSSSCAREYGLRTRSVESKTPSGEQNG